jgi:hypothetical protein
MLSIPTIVFMPQRLVVNDITPHTTTQMGYIIIPIRNFILRIIPTELLLKTII